MIATALFMFCLVLAAAALALPLILCCAFLVIIWTVLWGSK